MKEVKSYHNSLFFCCPYRNRNWCLSRRLGGGIIIKPVLDLIGRDSIGMISILSASTIFSMSVVSLIHALVSKRKVNLKLSLLLSTGAIMGGVIGKKH